MFEDGDIPKVDEKKAEVARKQEGERENFEVEKRLEVHPGDDHHPHHEGFGVKEGPGQVHQGVENRCHFTRIRN